MPPAGALPRQSVLWQTLPRPERLNGFAATVCQWLPPPAFPRGLLFRFSRSLPPFNRFLLNFSRPPGTAYEPARDRLARDNACTGSYRIPLPLCYTRSTVTHSWYRTARAPGRSPLFLIPLFPTFFSVGYHSLPLPRISPRLPGHRVFKENSPPTGSKTVTDRPVLSRFWPNSGSQKTFCRLETTVFVGEIAPSKCPSCTWIA